MHRCLGTCLIAQWRLKKDVSNNRAKLGDHFPWEAFSAVPCFFTAQLVHGCTVLLLCHAPNKCIRAYSQRRLAAGLVQSTFS